jgi:hypothetical protein
MVVIAIALLTLSCLLASSHAFVVVDGRQRQRSSSRVFSTPEADLDHELYEIAKRLTMEIYDEGIYGLHSQDPRYGLEVVKSQVETDGGWAWC